MTAAILQFTIASAIIVVAAIILTRFADAFAKLSGLGHLVVGSVLLAAATSLPELSVNWAIVRLEIPNMAIGGLVGSSLFNLGILAVADLSHKARGVTFSRKSVENALPGVVSIGMTAIVGIGVFVGDRVGSYELGGIGMFAFVMLGAYLLGLRLIYHDQLSEREPNPEEPTEGESRSAAMVRSISGFVVAAIAILIAAPYSASAAETIADQSGMGRTFVGTTLVALATSLPELVSCIAAARIGAINLAIGNVFGSNTFNLLLLIPLDLAHSGSLIGAVDPIHLLTCMAVILVTSVVIVGQLYRVESRKLLIEPDALLVLLLVVTSLVLIYYCR